MSAPIKLSSPATHEFWEIPVLFEDEHLLALDKPAALLVAPDADDPQRLSLLKLLHAGIAEGKPWAKERRLAYLMNAHRLDFETTGVLLLAKSKDVFLALANLFGSEKPQRIYLALVHGSPRQKNFEIRAPIAPQPDQPGLMRVDQARGKHATTQFEVVEEFTGYALLRSRPLTDRPQQIRVHLHHAGLPIAGDSLHGGRPLMLSKLKRDYRLKEGRTERPLTASLALHAESLTLAHPVTGAPLTITAPWPKDLNVAVKYLRRYAVPAG